MQIAVIANNIRSVHNVGSILRTCDGFGVRDFFAVGYTPHPSLSNDHRLPHVQAKMTAQLHKTALGAEKTVHIAHYDTLAEVVRPLRARGFAIFALEQSPSSVALSTLPKPLPEKIALILGNEPEGLTPNDLRHADQIIEIRMFGTKESFNVSVAAGIALYELTKNP